MTWRIPHHDSKQKFKWQPFWPAGGMADIPYEKTQHIDISMLNSITFDFSGHVISEMIIQYCLDE